MKPRTLPAILAGLILLSGCATLDYARPATRKARACYREAQTVTAILDCRERFPEARI